MDEKSKSILVFKRGNNFSLAERHQIIQELISTKCTKQEIWEKYTGYTEEHGQLLRWMRKLGYDDKIKTRRPNFVANYNEMAKKENIKNPSEEYFENLQLKKRISELETQLKDAEMKAIAFSTMVDIAEEEFNISIRKKFNTKPLKK